MAVNALDVIRVIAKMSQVGQQVLNVYELIHAGDQPVAAADLFTAILNWLDGAYDRLDQGLTDDLTFDTIQAINVTQEEELGEAAWPTLVAGGATVNEACPLQVAALVRFPTDYLGSQGRKYIGGLTEGQLDANGVISTGTLGGLALYGADILGGVTVDSQDFVPGCDNPDKLRFAAFQSAIVNDIVSTQRRRKQGVGV